MTPDAALDNFAFFVSLRLMGPDACRRLRISLARDPESTTHPGFNVEYLERVDALADGRREPETLQDRLDIARAARDRAAPPFQPAFWLRCVGDLSRAGFTAEQAARLVSEVRAKVDPAYQPEGVEAQEEEYAG